MESAQPIDDATIVMRDGVIQSVGAASPPPAGARIVDAEGRVVTPGLMTGGSQLGLTEILSLPDTRDYAVASGPLGAAFDVQYAINSNSTLAAPGVERWPHAGRVLSRGLGRGAFCRPGCVAAPGLDVRPARDRACRDVRENWRRRRPPAVGGSRSAAWILLRNALEEARRFKPASGIAGPRDQLLNHLDAEALRPVVAGRMPLAIVADRESDHPPGDPIARRPRLCA